MCDEPSISIINPSSGAKKIDDKIDTVVNETVDKIDTVVNETVDKIDSLVNEIDDKAEVTEKSIDTIIETFSDAVDKYTTPSTNVDETEREIIDDPN